MDADRGRQARRSDLGGTRPRHSYARTSYHLSERDGGGTRFDYENEFKAPGGSLGRGVESADRRRPEREARKSLERLKKLLES